MKRALSRITPHYVYTWRKFPTGNGGKITSSCGAQQTGCFYIAVNLIMYVANKVWNECYYFCVSGWKAVVTIQYWTKWVTI